jgi:hypothetical protein
MKNSCGGGVPRIILDAYYGIMRPDDQSSLRRGHDAIVIESLKIVKVVPSFHSYWRKKMQSLTFRRPNAEILEGDFFFLTGEPSRQVINVLETVLKGSPFHGSLQFIVLCTRYMVEYMFVDQRILDQQIFFVESEIFMEELEKTVSPLSASPPLPPVPPSRSISPKGGGGRKVMKASVYELDDFPQNDSDKEASIVRNIFDSFLPNHDLESGKNGVLCPRAGFAGCFRGLPPKGFSMLRHFLYGTTDYSGGRIYMLPSDAPYVVLEAVVEILNGKNPERFYCSEERLCHFRPITNVAIEYLVENLHVSMEDIDSLTIYVPNDYIMRRMRVEVEKRTGMKSREYADISCSAIGGGGKKKAVYENKDDEVLCVICFTERKDTVLLPCSHLAACSSCFSWNGKCET